MAVRSLEIGHARRTSAGTTLLFAVPANKTLIIKSIRFDAAAGLNVSGYVFATRSSGNWPLWRAPQTATPYNVGLEEAFIVLEPGDTVSMSVAGTSSPDVIVWLSGALLDGTA